MNIPTIAGAIALLVLPATVAVATARPIAKTAASPVELSAAAKKKAAKKAAKPKVEYMRAVPWK